jgi:hypothetical protein
MDIIEFMATITVSSKPFFITLATISHGDFIFTGKHRFVMVED